MIFFNSCFNEIEEYELNPNEKDLIDNKTCFEVNMYYNGSISSVNKSDFYDDRLFFWKDSQGEFFMKIDYFANNENEAIKIANEKRKQIKKMNWGIDT